MSRQVTLWIVEKLCLCRGGDHLDKEKWQKSIAVRLGKSVTITDIRTIRDWSESRVMRIVAAIDGEAPCVYYAKLAHSGFSTEQAVYRLASHTLSFPAPHGTVMKINGQEWLLLHEARGRRLANCSPQEYRIAAALLAKFHELGAQSAWAEQAGASVSLPKRISIVAMPLFNRLKELVTTKAFTNVDNILLELVTRHLETFLPQLISHLSTMPLTLVHGDCHSGNIFICDDRIELVDWGGAFAAPGLYDVVALIDVAQRMSEPLDSPSEIVDAYWECISNETRQAYGVQQTAWKMLRITRALLELDWFMTTGEDYGDRANRELTIIRDNLDLTCEQMC